MARPSNKTPEQQRDIALAALERANAKIAKSANQGDPVFENLQKRSDILAKDIAGYSRKSSGFNSFENRRNVANLRLQWIDCEQALTTAEDKLAKQQREYLANVIASFDPATYSEQTMLEDMPTDPTIEGLQKAYDDANKAWRAASPAALKNSEEKEAISPELSEDGMVAD